MRRFYFHLVYPTQTISDLEGSELAGFDIALTEAKAIIRDLAAEHLRAAKTFTLSSVQIAGQNGDVLAIVDAGDSLREIITVGPA